jgi:hypothetical protein
MPASNGDELIYVCLNTVIPTVCGFVCIGQSAEKDPGLILAGALGQSKEIPFLLQLFFQFQDLKKRNPVNIPILESKQGLVRDAQPGGSIPQ